MRRVFAVLAAAASATCALGLGALTSPAAALEAPPSMSPAPEVAIEGDLRVAESGLVEYTVAIPDGIVALTLRLPELRCPAGLPLVEDGRFGRSPDRPVSIPSGVELASAALRVIRATWAPFAQDEAYRTVALDPGSTVELEGLPPGGSTAVFALHCTDDPDRSLDVALLGSIPDPPPLRIGGLVQERLTPKPGVWIREVRDLPYGLNLDRSGVLTGEILPTAARDHPVTVVITDGFASATRRLTLRIGGGETIWHLSQSWTLTGRNYQLGEFRCPPDHPWTIDHDFQPGSWIHMVPRGVQVISEGGVSVESKALYQNGLGRGMVDVTANNLLPFGIPSALHFRLHCTNDSNQASRR
jgi:hypothetical protein